MVEVALVVIGVILIGLPLLALGVDRVLPAPRHRPIPPSRDPTEIVRQEFGLTWQDQAEVAAAVRGARAAARPELRPATRRLAELTLHPPLPTFRGRPISDYPRWQRRTAQGVFAAVLLIYVVAPLFYGRFESAVVPVVYAVMFLVGLPLVRRRRRHCARIAFATNR